MSTENFDSASYFSIHHSEYDSASYFEKLSNNFPLIWKSIEKWMIAYLQYVIRLFWQIIHSYIYKYTQTQAVFTTDETFLLGKRSPFLVCYYCCWFYITNLVYSTNVFHWQKKIISMPMFVVCYIWMCRLNAFSHSHNETKVWQKCDVAAVCFIFCCGT